MAGRGVICAIYGCNNYRQQSDRKSFYRFPRNKEICKQWVIRSRRADLDEIFKKCGPDQLNKCHLVCSDHFVEKDFRNKNLLSQGILPGSVPSVLPHAKESNFRASPKKRKREEEVEPQESDNIHAQVDDIVSAKVTKDCKKCFPLVAKCRALQKTVSRQKGVIRSLRSELRNLKGKVMKCNCDKSKVCNDVAGKFITLQESMKNRKPEGRRYTEEDRRFALALHFCSPKSYRFLQTYFCLPTTRTIRSWLQNADVKPGINNLVLDLLQLKSEKMIPEEKVVSVVFDEMSLKSLLSYSPQNDLFEGFEDIGAEFCSVSNLTERQLCNQAMVVMVKGLYLNFKQ